MGLGLVPFRNIANYAFVSVSPRLFQLAILSVCLLAPTKAQTLVLTPNTTMLNSAGGSVTFTAALNYSTTPSSLGFTVQLPAGWSYLSGTSVPGTSEPAIVPAVGSTGQLGWAFINLPANSATFTFTAAYSASLTGSQVFSLSLIARGGTGGSPITTTPPPILMPNPSTFLSWSGGNGNWSDTAQWSPNTVPNNNGSTHYSATVAAGIAALNSSFTVDNLTFTGGTINGSGNLTLTSLNSTWTGGIFAGTGELIISSGAQLAANGSNAHSFSERTIRNQGTFAWNDGGALEAGTGSQFINSAGATFVDGTTGSSDNLIRNASGGTFTFTNAGTYSKTSSATTHVSVPFTNSGNITVSAGSLRFSNSFVQNAGIILVSAGAVARFDQGLNFAAGTLHGGGTVIADVTNSGFISPGNTLGTLTVTGNLTLLAGSQLSFDIGGKTQGTTYDFLSVSGNATFGGTLAIAFTTGTLQSILPTDTFTLLSASSINGAFANVASGSRLMTNFGQGSFVVNYSGSSLTLSSFEPVPEPSTWALLIGGGVSIAILARRRRP